MNFQQPFTPWPNTPGWQGNGQNNYDGANFYQNQTATTGYLNDQQDYVPFDDGEDFYPAEATPTAQAFRGQSQQNGISRQNTSAVANHPSSNPPSNNSSNRASISGGVAPALKAGEKQQPQDNSLGQNSQKEPSKEAEGRLEFLRAKLLAGKANGGKTPTPEPKAAKTTGGNESLPSSTVKAGNEKIASIDTVKQDGNVQLPNTAKGSAPAPLVKNDKPITNSMPPLNQQAASATDIDALFNEARVAEAAKKSKPAPPTVLQRKDPLPQKETVKTLPKPTSVMLATHNTPVEAIINRPPSRPNPSPSEVSEQGEIREDQIKQEQPTSKPSSGKEKPQDLKEKGKQIVPTSTAPNSKANVSSKQPEKIDTAMANGRRDSGIDSAKTKSPSARILPVSRPRDVHDPPAPTDTREDTRRGRNTEPVRDRQEAEIERSRERYPYRESFRPERDGFRPPRKRYSWEEAEKEAAEYKRNLQIARARAPDDALALRSVEKALPSPKAEISEQKSEVQEWLEMTGYYDEAYRKKALFNHRSLSALDRQRAELERQIQLDLEERLQISRTRSLSIRPRESIESPAMRNTMAPPPIPTKETKDELGIQIKDLANRDTLAAAKRIEDGSRPLKQDSAMTNLAPATKRQQPDDGFESPTANRPLEKLARTDSKEYSKAPTSPPTARAPMPLESRISVDNGTYKREYSARSRSPRRSPSPAFRRASGQGEMHSGASSRTGYSPLRRPNMSRDASPFNRRDSGLSYDEERETTGPRGRHQSYRHDNDDSSYTPPYANGRGSHYSSYRGRTRGRGHRSAYFNNARGGKPYDRAGSE